MTASRTKAPAHVTGAAFAFGSAFFYGTTVLFSRILAKSALSVPTVLGVRFGVAGALLAVVLFIGRGSLVPVRGERLRAFGLGALSYSTQSALFFSALQRGSAAAVTLLFYAFPAIVVLVEIPLERRLPKRSTLVALGLSVAGVAAIIAASGDISISAAGIAIALTSGGAFGAYVLASNRLIAGTPPPTTAMWVCLGCALSILTFGAASGSLHSPGRYWAPLLGNAVVTACAFAFLFAALPRIGASRTSVIMTLEAFFAIVLTSALLDESVRLVQIVGGAAILAGAALIAVSGTPEAERPGLVGEP